MITSRNVAYSLIYAGGLLAFGSFESPAAAQESQPEPRTVVKAYVQMRPGGERAEVEMPVYESPVDLPIVAASEAELEDDDLVMGVVNDGQAMAWPIRYLSMYEVVNSQAGKKPVAPTW